MTAIQRAEDRVTLLKDAATIASRLREIESEQEMLLDRRSQACRHLRAAGASIKDLQEVFGISRSRIQQVLRKSDDQ